VFKCNVMIGFSV